ncbi:MAG: hypothetical protein LBT95_03895, partial [Treponema sp.]|nr:hypothetical protein [Treponema sp.]
MGDDPVIFDDGAGIQIEEGPDKEAESPADAGDDPVIFDDGAGTQIEKGPDKETESPADWENPPVSFLNEIWGYLLADQEETLKPEYPLSDIVYFGAEVST